MGVGLKHEQIHRAGLNHKSNEKPCIGFVCVGGGGVGGGGWGRGEKRGERREESKKLNKK